MIRSLPLDDASIDAWFARHITTSRRSQPLVPPEPAPDAEEVSRALGEGRVLRRAEGCRMAFLEAGSGLRLYVEGEEIVLPRQALGLVEALTGRRELMGEDLAEALGSSLARRLIVDLVGRGALYLA